MAPRKATNSAMATRNRGNESTTTNEDDASNDNGFFSTPIMPTTPAVSAPFASLQNITAAPQALLNVINELSQLGLGKGSDGIELPKIVAVGDQSAGKSSVIAAISGITVPRQSGMCTRCPAHINLRRAPPDTQWHCKISIEWPYMLDQNKQWQEVDEPVLFEMATITNSREIGRYISLAQRATLNPQRHPSSFISDDLSADDESHEDFVQLSPNMVRLDIYSSDCPNLTFYDLPGVINFQSRQQKHLTKQVRDLVTRYIAKEDNILLLAVAMDRDPESSAAATLIQDAGAEYRTLGVWTKPDQLLNSASVDKWTQILACDVFELGHGYFITKQPSQPELDAGIDNATARANEDEFFRGSPWTDRLAEFHSLFGTLKMQARLSHLLVTQIRSRIPALVAQVDRKIRVLEIDLANIPLPPGNEAASKVNNILSSLRMQVERVTTGEIPHTSLIQGWMEICREFSDSLHNYRPTLIKCSVAEKNELAARRQAQSAEDVVELTDGEATPPATPPSNRKRHPKSPANTSPTKRARQAAAAPLSSRYHLEQLQQLRQRLNTSAIAGTDDHRADEFMITSLVSEWRAPLQAFIQASVELLQATLRSIITELLRPWQTTPLSQQLPVLIDQVVVKLRVETTALAMRLLEAEKLKPMTLNLTAVARSQRQETHTLRLARAEVLEELQKPPPGTRLSQRPPPMSREELLANDEYAREVEAMGRVRGYYDLAASNFADTMSKLLRVDLFGGTRASLVDTIQQELGIMGPDGFERAQALLEENSSRAVERARLTKELDKYHQARAKLDEVLSPSPAPANATPATSSRGASTSDASMGNADIGL